MRRDRFKKIIIIVWTIWWLIALWTDIVGGLAHFGLLVKSWAPDHNYLSLAASLTMYAVPQWLITFLFGGIIFWSFISALLFCWACFHLHKDSSIWMRYADFAFITSISFWFAFFLADQLVMKYDLEENHMVQGGMQLLCYLTLYLLPTEQKSNCNHL